MAVTPTESSESTLTDRYQTTVPSAIRQVLGLNKRDKIRYTIHPDGQVTIARADQNESDPILEKFLDFLAEDMGKNPGNIKGINSDLVNHIQALVSEVELDLDAPLSPEAE
jgi:antitoxin PrlF